CHRVLRGQAFTAPGLTAHFTLFALVSSARDEGSGRVEARMVADHLLFWARVLGELAPSADPYLAYTLFGASAVRQRVGDTVRPVLRGAVELVEEPERTQGAHYYDKVALGLRAREDGQVVDLGDGGLTDWTARLLGDAKERCVISCLATERLAQLRGGVSG